MEQCNLLSLGQDLRLLSYRKIFVSQIVNVSVTDINSYAMVFHFDEKPILKVEVVGILRGIECKRGKMVYACDDGTGLIYCILFSDVPISPLAFSLGNLVSVKGSIAKVETNSIKYSIVLRVSHMTKLTDPNLELLHWTQVIHQKLARTAPAVTNLAVLASLKNVDHLISGKISFPFLCRCDDSLAALLRCRLMLCKCNLSSRCNSLCLLDLKVAFLCFLLGLEDDLEDQTEMLKFTMEDILRHPKVGIIQGHLKSVARETENEVYGMGAKKSKAYHSEGLASMTIGGNAKYSSSSSVYFSVTAMAAAAATTTTRGKGSSSSATTAISKGMCTVKEGVAITSRSTNGGSRWCGGDYSGTSRNVCGASRTTEHPFEEPDSQVFAESEDMSCSLKEGLTTDLDVELASSSSSGRRLTRTKRLRWGADVQQQQQQLSNEVIVSGSGLPATYTSPTAAVCESEDGPAGGPRTTNPREKAPKDARKSTATRRGNSESRGAEYGRDVADPRIGRIANVVSTASATDATTRFTDATTSVTSATDVTTRVTDVTTSVTSATDVTTRVTTVTGYATCDLSGNNPPVYLDETSRETLMGLCDDLVNEGLLLRRAGSKIFALLSVQRGLLLLFEDAAKRAADSNECSRQAALYYSRGRVGIQAGAAKSIPREPPLSASAVSSSSSSVGPQPMQPGQLGGSQGNGQIASISSTLQTADDSCEIIRAVLPQSRTSAEYGDGPGPAGIRSRSDADHEDGLESFCVTMKAAPTNSHSSSARPVETYRLRTDLTDLTAVPADASTTPTVCEVEVKVEVKPSPQATPAQVLSVARALAPSVPEARLKTFADYWHYYKAQQRK